MKSLSLLQDELTALIEVLKRQGVIGRYRSALQRKKKEVKSRELLSFVLYKAEQLQRESKKAAVPPDASKGREPGSVSI